MRLDGRRTSRNVSDRRGSTGRRLGVGGGIVGVILIAVVTLLGGGGVGDIFNNILGNGVSAGNPQSEYVTDAEDTRLADLASKVLAGTEDVWTEEFRRRGWGEYECPRMVLYTGSVNTGCGQGTFSPDYDSL